MEGLKLLSGFQAVCAAASWQEPASILIMNPLNPDKIEREPRQDPWTLLLFVGGCLGSKSVRREPLGASGSLWEPLGPSGSIWEPLGAFGSVWELLGASGSLWERLGTSGNL